MEASPKKLNGHQGPIRSLSFSPSGRWLASGSAFLLRSRRECPDRRVLLWDINNLHIVTNGNIQDARKIFDKTILQEAQKLIVADAKKLQPGCLSSYDRHVYPADIPDLKNNCNPAKQIHEYLKAAIKLDSKLSLSTKKYANKIAAENLISIIENLLKNSLIYVSTESNHEINFDDIDQKLGNINRLLSKAGELDSNQQNRISTIKHEIGSILIGNIDKVLYTIQNLETANKLFERAKDFNPHLNIVNLKEKKLQNYFEEKLNLLTNQLQNLSRSNSSVVESIAQDFRDLSINASKIKIDAQEKTLWLIAINKAIKEAVAGNVQTAFSLFEKANQLQPHLNLNSTLVSEIFASLPAAKLASEGKIKESIQRYSELTSKQNDFQGSAQFWNELAWFGCLYGYAAEVQFAADKAVQLDDKNPGYRDTRGLVLALTGNSQEAVKEFLFYIEQLPNDIGVGARKQWIEELNNNKNPFSDNVIDKLREETEWEYYN